MSAPAAATAVAAAMPPQVPAAGEARALARVPALPGFGREVSAMERLESHPRWPLLATLPFQLTATLPIPNFRVRDLLALREGRVVETGTRTTGDVLLRVGDVALGATEFEVVDGKLAVRITRLA